MHSQINILYIGNKLSKHGATPTTVETLGELLSEYFKIISVSDKKYRLYRLLDMLYSIIKFRKETSLILIDTYSTSNFYFALFSSFLANILKIPYIPILHGGSLPRRLENSPASSKYIFNNSKINIAPSYYLKNAFDDLGYKTQYIANSIDIENYGFRSRELFNPKLLYVRAFSKVYNPQLAIKVMDLLVKEYPNAELCMVGPDKDGTLKDVENLVVKYNLENNIKITGKLEKKEWIQLSKNYDIFINTTNFDNTPVSVIEAMALGLPVVTTNVGGIPFMLEDGVDSLLVNPDNEREMLNKIKYLLDNQNEATKLAIEGRKTAETFSWRRIKEEWIKVIKENSL